MRGFLRSTDTLLSLAPKITTVGRENCDITIQSPSVDLQHALVEFCEEENCYVLQDLNSAQGTYINETRIQNAAVRLAPFDQIRFGYGGSVYQFELDDPSIQQRGWQANSSITRNPYQPPPQEQGLPHLPLNTQPASLPSWTSSAPTALPQHATVSLRSRPLSAGARRHQTDIPTAIRGSWVTGSPAAGDRPADSPTTDILTLQKEKDQKIARLNDELMRLQAIQKDYERKNLKIEQLNSELTQLKQQMAAQQQNSDTNKMVDKLEKELHSKKTEIAVLKDKVNKLERSRKNLISEDTVTVQEFNDKLQELHSVRAELERVRKDKNIISGLVNQTQRDMSSKDTSISRLTREIEQLKKDVRNRDVQIATLTSKMSRVKQSAQDSSEETARDKELVGLRLQFKNAENKIQELTDGMKTMKAEMDRKEARLAESSAEQMKLQSEVQHCKAEFLDAQRAERAIRVDLEQVNKKAERFRNRVVQVAFSTPGVKYPDDEMPDDQLMDALKKLIDERTTNQKQITEMKEQIKQQGVQEKKGEKALKALKQHLSESHGRLQASGLLSGPLKQELSLLQALSFLGASDTIQIIKQVLVDNLQAQLNWQQDIEDALEKCGINVALSTDAPSKHISGLFSKWEKAIKDKDSVESTIRTIEANHKAELATQAANLKQEMTEKISEAREQARREGIDSQFHRYLSCNMKLV
ncbi:hypothetical protein EB796_002768 [Bugula neritina]|uniref:FHA domain-containing protein n=1 Tax=Bugula neritina TaxID=10212 RepID=A0A7J7KLG1_BUGNE|nr:hypothetical protein EB796_002768 [Bugula neritina]